MPPLAPDVEHRYQIGEMPVFLTIRFEQGKPRLSFVMTQRPDGTVCNPPEHVHLATFRDAEVAGTLIAFLDAMHNQLTNAIEFHKAQYAAFTKMHASIAFPSPEKGHGQN